MWTGRLKFGGVPQLRSGGAERWSQAVSLFPVWAAVLPQPCPPPLPALPQLTLSRKREENAGSEACLSGHFPFLSSLPLIFISSVQFSCSFVSFVTPWTAARQASLSITHSQGVLKLMSIKLVMPANHLILGHPLLLPPSIFPSIRVFSNESVLCIR